MNGIRTHEDDIKSFWGTLKGLQECIDETTSRRGLGSVRHEDLDEAGPGYSIRAPQVGPGKVEDGITSIQVK